MSVPTTLSIRIDFPGGGRLGPGKAALLQGISEAGSIRSAADALGMSYPKALKLVEQMHADFKAPLIHSHHGGRDRGGSKLTETGKAVLTAYVTACAEAEKATTAQRRTIASALRPQKD